MFLIRVGERYAHAVYLILILRILIIFINMHIQKFICRLWVLDRIKFIIFNHSFTELFSFVQFVLPYVRAFYTQRPSRMYHTFYFTYVYNTLIEPWNQGSFLRRSHKCARVIEFIDVSHSRFLKHVLVMFFSE